MHGVMDVVFPILHYTDVTSCTEDKEQKEVEYEGEKDVDE